VIDFLSGASVLAAAAIALFFWRFWRETGDRFFVLFSLAFAVFAVNRLALVAIDSEEESRTWVYVVRLAAFLLIAAAIVDKNRPRGQSSSAERSERT
jgi:predicted permease